MLEQLCHELRVPQNVQRTTKTNGGDDPSHHQSRKLSAKLESEARAEGIPPTPAHPINGIRRMTQRSVYALTRIVTRLPI